MPAGLVGRGAELDSLRVHLRRAAGGSGTAVVVEGEAGIGKTRLLREFVRHAGETGATVWCGAADELARSRPFGALAEAFATAGSAMAELLGTAARGGTGPAAFEVIDRVLDHIERVATAGPVVVALDDLHWADPPTLLALHGLTKRISRLPIAVVVTLRPVASEATLDRVL